MYSVIVYRVSGLDRDLSNGQGDRHLPPGVLELIQGIKFHILVLNLTLYVLTHQKFRNFGLQANGEVVPIAEHFGIDDYTENRT